jgi:hypothetical protein
VTASPSNADWPEDDEIEERIRRLGKRRVLEVPKILEFHTWLDSKRLRRRLK